MSAQVVTSEDAAEQNKSLQFRLIKSFEDLITEEGIRSSGHCLEISQRYGVTFILNNGSLRVVESKGLLVNNSLPPAIRNNVEVIGLSSDDSLLAIGTGSSVSIFETKAFCLQPTAAPVRCSFVVSKSGGATSQLAWNPTDTRLIAALSQDGTVLLIRVLDNWSIEAVFAFDPSFRCMSWSPKGKQLVVGGTNAIVQLKLDLKEAKKIPLPPGQELVSIHWLSTLQFLASFQPSSRDDLKIMLLTLSKTASPLYKDFGDVFLSDDFSSIKVLSKHIPPWRVHLLGSSTSSDVIVVCHDPSQPTSDMMVQEIDDRYRAALPLDHFCRGIGIYLGCSESVVVNGDDLQACPLLVLLSQKGLVTLFRVVNEGFDSIHVPAAEPINIVSLVNPPVVQPTLVTPAPVASGAPIFGNLNIGAPAAKSSLSISTPAIAHGGAGLSTATSVPSAIFGLTPAKSVTVVAPNTGSASLASKNLFGSLPTSTAVPPTFGFTSTSKLDDKSDGIKSSAFGQIVGTQSQGGGGDAPSLVVAPTSFQAAKDTPTPKSAAKAVEYKHLLEQLKQFHIRYNNFKKLHLQQSKNQLDAINQYFAKLDSHILKDLHKMSDFASDIVETTNGQKEEVDGLYMNMQNLFTKIEFGLIAAEKSKDSKYLLLLRAQPIDPVSLAKLTKVEKSYIYLRNQLKEARRHFYYQEQNFRPLQGSMSVDFIFQTMANHALIIQNLHRQALELRRRISEQQIQLITSTGNANVTLDDIASGISHLKLKPNKQDENNILAKPPIVYRKDKLSELKRWAGHTLITRIPVTGAIDPYLPIAQVRKIRLNPESLTDSVDVQPVVSSAVPEFKQEAKEAAFTINTKTDTPKASLFGAPNNINFSASGATPASGSQLSFFSSASSFPNSASTTPIAKPAQILEYPVSTSGGEVASSAFTRAFGTISAPSNFGSTSFSTTTTKSSVFGTVSPPANKQVSIFGGGSVSTAASAIPAFSFTSSQASTSLFSSIQPTAEPKTTVSFPVPTATFPAAAVTSTVSFITTSTPAASSVLGSQLFGTKSAATTTTTTSFFGSASSVSLFGAPKTVEPASIFASTKTTDESLSFGIPKAKDELPAVDSIVTTIGEVKTDVSSIKTAYTLAGLPMTTAPALTSAVSSTGTSLFGTKAAPLFGQPVVTSSFIGSKPFGSGSSLFGTTTTASSDFGSSSSAFGNASIFGGVTQTLKTEGTTTPTATGTATKMPLFGLPKPQLVTSTLPIEQSDKVAESITTSLPTPTSTASVVSTIPLTTPADSSTTTGSVLSPGSSAQETEEKQTESVVADSMKAPSAISSASENTSLFGSMSLTTSAPSLFGSMEPKGVTSIFGGDSSSSGTASIFGKPSTTSADSLFGTTSSSSLFGAPVTTANLFGAPATTANLFGAPVTTEPTTTPSLFASSGATTSLFESPTAVGTTSSSLFGAPANTSIFGTPAVSVFETNTPTAFGSGSVVSSVATPSLFGTPTTTAPSTLFGLSDSKPAGASIFGGTPSVFGVSNTSGTDTKQIFGSPATTPATAGQSVFGAPAFGSPGFGTPTAATSPGLFGAPFGSSGTNLVKPAATVFGGAQTGSVFGASATATTAASAFGSSSPTAPAFGGGAVFGGSPAFGSTIKPSSFGSSSIFGGGTSAAGPTFGALAGSGTPAPSANFGAPAVPVFGSPQQQPQNSAFGGAATFGSPPAFGAQPQSQSMFASPAFGATGGSAFGQQQPLSSAFGGGAVFGGSPAFGSTAKTATFGASNTPSIFGGGVDNSNTSFGNVTSTQPAFGSSQNTGGFAAAPQPSFGSFSSFGQAPTQPAFGGSAFGGGFNQQDQSQQKQPQQKTASFGGSSFSSWR